MNNEEVKQWIKKNVAFLEEKYLAEDEPWKQSGFSGPEERWVKCRKPIADCMDHHGSFLDIGCANGYLLQCVLDWKRYDGLKITPFGLDIGEGLIRLAKKRLPAFADHFFVDNALTWEPPRRFDFIRTELVYVPEELYMVYVDRLFSEFLNPRGKLLVCEYRSRKQVYREPWINEKLIGMGYEVSETRSGWYDGKELTRVAVIQKQA